MSVSVTSTSKSCDRGAFLAGAIYSRSLLDALSTAALEHDTDNVPASSKSEQRTASATALTVLICPLDAVHDEYPAASTKGLIYIVSGSHDMPAMLALHHTGTLMCTSVNC